MKTIVEIEKIVFGGDGLARLLNGKVIFVPFVIPGEKVKVKITKDYGDYLEGEVEEIIEASPYRKTPLCKYYGICGGCQFQHIDYSYQLEIKKHILLETFKRQGWKEEIFLERIIPSSKEFSYRNRLRFHVENTSFKMGFVRRKTHEVLKIEKCLLGEEILNRVLEKLYTLPIWIKLARYSKRLKIESSPEENKATLIFWTSVAPTKEDMKEFRDIDELKAVFFWLKGKHPEGPYPQESSYGGRRVFKNIDGIYYYVQPGVFVQTNWEINLAIMKTIREWNLEYKTVLDLHAGMGNFIFPLMKEEVKKALGVDTDIRAIEDGIYTAEKNNINGKLDLRNMSATEVLYEIMKWGERFDVILLDPPRGGCKEILKFLPNVNHKYLIYISCDAPTFVRDLKILKDLKYELKKIYLFDMFPQTYHFEVLALLVKKS